MVATAPSTPAGPLTQGRSASRIASDRRGATWVSPENGVSEQLARRPEHAVAPRCISRPRPHRRDAHPGRRRFSGQTRNGRYSWARYYHPDLQRFISEDPLRFVGGDPNFYAYVGNGPINSRDPLGLWTVSLGTTVGAAVGFGGGGGTFVNVGHDPTQGWLSGWSLSVTGTAAGGAVAGAGYTAGISLSVSTANDVSGLLGTFYEAGRGGLGRTGVGYFESPDRLVQGGTVSISLPGGRGYLGASVGASTTSALVQWVQGRSLSFGATDGASIVTIPLSGRK